jgi:hypothetical protein
MASGDLTTIVERFSESKLLVLGDLRLEQVLRGDKARDETCGRARRVGQDA